jgi:hypothetical protein
MAPSRVNADRKQKSLLKHKTLEQHFQQTEGHRTNSQAKARPDASMNKQDACKENMATTGGTTLSSSKAIGGKEVNHNKTPITLPTQVTTKKARDPSYNITLPAGAINIGGEEETNDMELEGGDTSPLRGLSLNEKFLERGPRGQPLVLEGLQFVATGDFPEIADGSGPQLGPISHYCMGNNALKRLVTSHRGRYISSVTKQTNFLIIGRKPNKKQIEKARGAKTKLITISTLEGIINGMVSSEEAAYKEAPDTRNFFHRHNPPPIHRETDLPEEEEEAAAAKVTLSGIRLKKRKEATTPEGTPDCINLIAGTELIRKRRTLDTSRLRKKTSKYVSMVHATLRIPHGDIKDLVM